MGSTLEIKRIAARIQVQPVVGRQPGRKIGGEPAFPPEQNLGRGVLSAKQGNDQKIKKSKKNIEEQKKNTLEMERLKILWEKGNSFR